METPTAYAAADKLVKRPKVPKEIQKLIKAFDNRRQHYFLVYLQDGELITSTNIKTNTHIDDWLHVSSMREMI